MQQQRARVRRLHHEGFYPRCRNLHGEDLHAAGGGHHQRHVDLDLKDTAVMAERVQQEDKEEDEAEGCQCVHQQQALH